MHSKATHVWAAPLDLAAVQSATDLDVHAPEPIAEREGTPDRPSGPIKRGDQPVSGGLHECASVPIELPLRKPIERIKDLTPTPIAELGGPLGRADDVGEQDRCQHAVGVNGCSRPGQEFLDLIDDRVDVPDRK